MATAGHALSILRDPRERPPVLVLHERAAQQYVDAALTTFNNT